jgi:hypothetical protein
MKTYTYPLAVPADLLVEVRQASQDLGLSMADIMRQSMKLGLPKLREQLAPAPWSNPRALSSAEARRCYQQPNREFDALEHHLAGLPSPPPEPEWKPGTSSVGRARRPSLQLPIPMIDGSAPPPLSQAGPSLDAARANPIQGGGPGLEAPIGGRRARGVPFRD